MSKRILDYDPLTRTTTYHDYDHDTGMTYIEEVEDVQPYLDYCKRLANDTDYKRKGIKEDWYHVATVPNTVLMKIKNEYHLDWMQKEDLPKILRVIQRDFKKLLTVDKI